MDKSTKQALNYLFVSHPYISIAIALILIVLGVIFYKQVLAIIFVAFMIAAIIFSIIGIRSTKADISTAWKAILVAGITITLLVAAFSVKDMVGIREYNDFREDFDDLSLWDEDEAVSSYIDAYGGKVHFDGGDNSIRLKSPIPAEGRIIKITFIMGFLVHESCYLYVYVSADGGDHWINEDPYWGQLKWTDRGGSILADVVIPTEYQSNLFDVKIRVDDNTFWGSDDWVNWFYVDWETGTAPGNPPYTPSSPSPSNGQHNIQVSNPQLSWTGGDPDGDLKEYIVYFEKGDSTPDNSLGSWTNEYAYTSILDYNSHYYWQVVAYDTSGLSTMGPVWDFYTKAGNTPPNVPSGASPISGASNVAITTELSWVCSDPDGDTLSYDIYLGTSSSPPFVGTVYTASYKPSTLIPNTRYYWKIVADDGTDTTSSPLWYFITGEEIGHEPYPPSSPIPANGASGVGSSTTLSWTGGDPDDDSLTYSIYLDKTLSPSTYIGSASDPNRQFPVSLESGNTYYWKVVASDGTYTTSSPVWHFSTAENILPHAWFVYSTSQLTVTFTDQSYDTDGTIVSWLWDFGDGGMSALQNPTHVYMASGTYAVTLTVTDNSGGTGTVEKQAEVTMPYDPIASFTQNISGLTVVFVDSSYDLDGTIVAWQWEFGDGKTSSVQSPTHKYSKSGNYNVKLTVTDNSGRTGVKSVNIAVEGGLMDYIYYIIGGIIFLGVVIGAVIYVKKSKPPQQPYYPPREYYQPPR